MEEFNFKENFEIGSSVSKLKKNNNEVIDLIKDLESRLDNIENSNLDNDETIIEIDEPEYEKPKKNKKHKENKEMKYKDIIVFMIIYILLSNKYTIELIYMIPYINTMDNPYPNLIIRTILFGLLVFLYKKYIK